MSWNVRNMNAEEFRNLTMHTERLRTAAERFDASDSRRIIDALELATSAHEGQKRDEGDPYVIHPIRVARMLIDDVYVADADLVIAALLHDVVEDTTVTLAEIQKKFGARVQQFVDGLTRDKTKETKEEKIKKTILGSDDVRLIKTCDCLDNLRSTVFRTDRGARWKRHLREAQDLSLPLARATKNTWLIREMEKVYDEVLRVK